MFNSEHVLSFASEYGFEIINSTPYYAHANGQAESMNKIIKNNIQCMILNNPSEWHELLQSALWAHQVGLKTDTRTSPYRLTYRLEAVLPFKIVAQLQRMARKNDFNLMDYRIGMMVKLKGLDWEWLEALDCIQVQKWKMACAYNKKAKTRCFQQADLIWKWYFLQEGKTNGSENGRQIEKDLFG